MKAEDRRRNRAYRRTRQAVAKGRQPDGTVRLRFGDQIVAFRMRLPANPDFQSYPITKHIEELRAKHGDRLDDLNHSFRKHNVDGVKRRYPSRTRKGHAL